MKKAWELSVLCAADVSILIFSVSGKAYEFSSRELDGELDRYLDVGVSLCASAPLHVADLRSLKA
jgi:hypothetical protein